MVVESARFKRGAEVLKEIGQGTGRPMDPRDEVIVHDFNLVLVSACREPDAVSFGMLDEDDHAYTQSLLKQATPFYAAPDFDRGRELK